jgi:hypothetical protein
MKIKPKIMYIPTYRRVLSQVFMEVNTKYYKTDLT